MITHNKKIKLSTAQFLIIILLLVFTLTVLFIVIGPHYRTILGIEHLYQTEIRPLIILYKMSFLSIPKMFAADLLIPEIDTKKIDLPIFYIYLKQGNLDKLNANLPASGENYVKGKIVFKNKTYDAELRYRGDNVGHWYLPKKSWRIKLKDKQLLLGTTLFNLINPKYIGHFENAIKFPIAQSMGVLAPRAFPVVVFLNAKYMGVYEFLDQPHETFLRIKNKLPGDIYFGDMPFEDENYSLFNNHEDWEVKPILDGNDKSARTRLQFLTSNIVNTSHENFYNFFVEHLGEPYLKFSAFMTLMGGAGTDNKHNHKYYLNPSNGIYEPIEWDTTFFTQSSLHRPPTHSQHDLDSLFFRYPSLVYQRTLILNKYLGPEQESAIIKKIIESSEQISYEIMHDKYKKNAAGSSTWILTNDEWKDNVLQLQQRVSERFSFLRNELDKTNITIFIINNTNIVFEISGISPVNIQKVHVKTPFSCISVYEDTNFDLVIGSTDRKNLLCNKNKAINIGLLYPGIKDKIHLAANHDDLIPGSLRYLYLFKHEENTAEQHLKTVFTFDPILNAVTKTSVKPKIIYLNSFHELPAQENTLSHHPWKLPAHENKTITLEGETTLTKNLLINKDDTLIIKPGTTIKLAKDVSILSSGKIVANGTQTQPITFIALTDKPWGAIALQGPNTNHSEFNHCNINGGSGTTHRTVHYTGMLSAYNTEITINNCYFKNNKKEDDAFNAKNSRVTITNTTFTNIFSDAIDFDFTTGTIENNKFDNLQGDAIDLMTSSPTIKNNQINNVGDKGISIGEKSNPIIVNNTITESGTAIAIKDQSTPTIINNTITNNQIGIAAYQKNWQYGGGGFGTVHNTNPCHNTQPTLIQNNSQITINNKTCTEKICEFTCKN